MAVMMDAAGREVDQGALRHGDEFRITLRQEPGGAEWHMRLLAQTAESGDVVRIVVNESGWPAVLRRTYPDALGELYVYGELTIGGGVALSNTSWGRGVSFDLTNLVLVRVELLIVRAESI